MKLDSKYFDCIRVKPGQDHKQSQKVRLCDWEGCRNAGTHRAPKGRGREGEYFMFCLDHVREYNKSYNYFNGMSDEEVTDYQKASMTGHRPTWSSGINAWSARTARADARRNQFNADTIDPFNLFPDAEGAGSAEQRRPARPIRNAERKAFGALDLPFESTAEDIKSRFKMLVKLHHPDSNGGDRSSEDQLRDIIQAYNYLKKAGFC
ncbi:MAG: J domain-containing protein [Hyphomicrobiales bacterium]|nr:J domain-containing protein [Hyphomicrobiales bacterium]